MFLGSNIPEGGRIGQYGLTRAQVDKVKEIERAITSDLSSHKTLQRASHKSSRFPMPACSGGSRKFMAPVCTHTLTRYRMAQAATLLRTTSKPIGEVAFEVGYTNASNLLPHSVVSLAWHRRLP